MLVRVQNYQLVTGSAAEELGANPNSYITGNPGNSWARGQIRKGLLNLFTEHSGSALL
jgi:hypothetical protein